VKEKGDRGKGGQKTSHERATLKAFSSTHHATKEKKEHFTFNTSCPKLLPLLLRSRKEETYNMIEENLMMTRPFHFWVVGVLCWGAGKRSFSLLYHTQFFMQGNCSFACSFLLLLAGGLGESMGGKRYQIDDSGRNETYEMCLFCFVVSSFSKPCSCNVATMPCDGIVDEPRMSEVVKNHVAIWSMSCVRLLHRSYVFNSVVGYQFLSCA
jgi:hypothetical protein